MKEGFELDITDIQIIVHKKENANFVFRNPEREFDGFIMITSGKGTVTDPEGARHMISKGDMIIANFGDRYMLEFEEPCSYVTSGLTLNTDKTLLPFLHKCSKKEYDTILDICEVWQSRSWDSYTKCRIKLMNHYLNLIHIDSSYINVDSDINNALKYIHKHFKTNFSGEEVASFCHVSLSYLRGKFLKQTGYTIVEYRDSLRIAAAKEMLKSGCFTVTEIASELGYCDVYHFSKGFSTHTGLSPTKWLHRFNG